MDLKKEREQLVAQRDNAFAVYHQAIGAIALLDVLIGAEEEKSLTLNELKELTGASEIGQPEPIE